MDNCLHIERPAGITDAQWKALRIHLKSLVSDAEYRFQDEDWRVCPHGWIESYVRDEFAAEKMNCGDC